MVVLRVSVQELLLSTKAVNAAAAVATPRPPRPGGAETTTTMTTRTKRKKEPTATFAAAAALFSPAVAAALATYKEQHGDLLVPSRFQVPPVAKAPLSPTATWPAATRGLKLGRVVSSLRTAYRKQQLPAATVAQLDTAGFVWNVRQYQGDRIVLALQTYKEVHGDIHVPKRFQCPSDDPRWPPAVRTLKLGYNLSNVRNRGDWVELCDRLEAIGLDIEHKYKDTRGWDLMLVAALRFKQLAGHARVPKEFEVPPAPPGMADQADADADGGAGVAKGGPLTWSSTVAAPPLPDAAVLAALKGVPSRVRLEHMRTRPELWPPECWGMKLGQKLSNIIYHASFAEQRAQFETAGIPEAVSKRTIDDHV